MNSDLNNGVFLQKTKHNPQPECFNEIDEKEGKILLSVLFSTTPHVDKNSIICTKSFPIYIDNQKVRN